jgi:hypothetical protein
MTNKTEIRIIFLLSLCSLFSVGLFAQDSLPVSLIRGVVTDGASRQTIPYATITVNTQPPVGTVSDSAGHFRVERLPVGRYDVRVSCMGYEPAFISRLTVTK